MKELEKYINKNTDLKHFLKVLDIEQSVLIEHHIKKFAESIQPQTTVTDSTIMNHFKSSTEIINGSELTDQCAIIPFDSRYREKEDAYRSGWVEGRNRMFIEIMKLQQPQEQTTVTDELKRLILICEKEGGNQAYAHLYFELRGVLDKLQPPQEPNNEKLRYETN